MVMMWAWMAGIVPRKIVTGACGEGTGQGKSDGSDFRFDCFHWMSSCSGVQSVLAGLRCGHRSIIRPCSDRWGSPFRTSRTRTPGRHSPSRHSQWLMIAALITVAGTVRAFHLLPFSAGVTPHLSAASVADNSAQQQNENASKTAGVNNYG